MNKNIKHNVRDFIIFCPFFIIHEWGLVLGIISAAIAIAIYAYLTNKPEFWSITKVVIFQTTFIILYYLSKALPDWSVLCNVLSIIVFGAVLIASISKESPADS